MKKADAPEWAKIQKWTDAPEWAMFRTHDRDGYYFWHEQPPEIDECNEEWISLGKVAMAGWRYKAVKKWRESLETRPEAKP